MSSQIQPSDLLSGSNIRAWAGVRASGIAEQLSDQILDDILKGRFPPGSPLREQALAQQFSVSRGPVREALKILQHDGVVRLIPNRGASVSPLQLDELQEIEEILSCLAPLVCRNAVKHASEHDRVVMKAAVDAIKSMSAHGDAYRFLVAFYRTSLFIAMVGSGPQLLAISTNHFRQLLRYNMLAFTDPGTRRIAASGWSEVYASLCRKDPKGMTAAYRDIQRRIYVQCETQLKQAHGQPPTSGSATRS